MSSGPRDDRTLVQPDDGDEEGTIVGGPSDDAERTIAAHSEVESADVSTEQTLMEPRRKTAPPPGDSDRTIVSAEADPDVTIAARPSAASDDAGATIVSGEGEAPGHDPSTETRVIHDDGASERTIVSGEGVVDEESFKIVDLRGRETSTSAAPHVSRDDRTMVGESVEHSPTSASATIPDAASRKSPTAKALTIGRFEVVKILGQGAFGTVYLAHDALLDRPVAIKVAKTGVLAGKADVDRFQREARSAAQLHHPYIVPVYEFGESHHQSYIAYEFIKGRTLKGYLEEKKKLTPEEACTLVYKLASALHYAHERGIVHRDMKPDNILIDEENEPHIADFGLARRDEGDVTRTREGLFMGTPAYMSPEQASGKAHLADGRADVWSLGVMLREMLTGKRPFDGKLTEVLRAVLEVEPPGIRTIDPKLPKDLETICQKCLTKQVEGRYQSGKELAEELDRWRRGEPILARPLGVLARTGRWMKRNPEIASLLGLVGFVLLAGFLVSSYFAYAAYRQEQLTKAAEARRAVTQLNGMLKAVPEAVPVLIEDLKENADDLKDRLHELNAGPPKNPREAMRARLAFVAILPGDADASKTLEQLNQDLTSAAPDDILAATSLLAPQSAELVPQLWAVARKPGDDEQLGAGRRLRAAAALATLDPQGPHWPEIASDTVLALCNVTPLELPEWLEAFAPVREVLRPELERQYAQGETAAQRRTSGVILANLFADDVQRLLAFIPNAEPEQVPAFVEVLSRNLDEAVPAIRKELDALLKPTASGVRRDDWETPALRLAAALASMGDSGTVLPLLADSSDKRFRSLFIDGAPRARVPWRTLSERLKEESDPIVLGALILTLGSYDAVDLPPSGRQELKPALLKLFSEHPHAGVHSAAEWTLRQLKFGGDVDSTLLSLRSKTRPAGKQWHVDPEGLSFSVIDGPVEFEMGCTGTDVDVVKSEEPHRRRIPRTFGIAMREVTVDEYLQFREDADYLQQFSPELSCPINNVRWYDAVKFCRWLSEREGVPPDEMCYPELDKIGDGMPLPSNLLDRTGYRLPTAAEWEYACRAGAAGHHPWSNRDELLERYVWFDANSENRMHPVGRLKPNDLGLFDVMGNAHEWCGDFFFDSWPKAGDDGVVVDGEDHRAGTERELRGGGFQSGIEVFHASTRDSEVPEFVGFEFGFRLCRTYRSSGSGDAAAAAE